MSEDQEKILHSPRSGFFSFIAQLSPRGGKKDVIGKDVIQKVEQNLENNLKDCKEEYEQLKEILALNHELILSKQVNYYKKLEKALFNLRSSLESTNQEEQVKALTETKNLQNKFLGEKNLKELLSCHKKLNENLPGDIREKMTFEKIKCKMTISLKDEMDGNINCVSISPNSHYIIVGVSESTNCAYIFSSFSGRLVKTLSGVDEIHSIVFSPDGNQIYSGGNNKITIWDFYSGKIIQTLEGHKRKINCMAISQDGKYLVSGDQNSNEDSTIIIWEIPTFKVSGKIYRLSKVKNISISDDSKQFFVEIESFSEPTYLLSYKMNGETINSKKISKRLDGLSIVGKELYYGEIKKEEEEIIETKVNVYSLEENTNKFSFTCKMKGISHIVPFPDGTHLAIVGLKDSNIHLYGGFGLDLGIIEGHKTEISSLMASPDGTFLVSTSISDKENSSMIKIWN